MKKTPSFAPEYPRWKGSIGFSTPKQVSEPLRLLNRILIGGAVIATIVLVGTRLTAI